MLPSNPTLDRDKVLIEAAYAKGRSDFARDLERKTASASTVRGDWLAERLQGAQVHLGGGHFYGPGSDFSNAVARSVRVALQRVLR